MAKTYYAATDIKFGKRGDGTEDGGLGKYEQKRFKPGDKVEGLSKEDMLGLWNAGALTDQKPETAEDDADEADEEEKEEETPKPRKRVTGSQSTPTPTPNTTSTPTTSTSGN
jgi:hypothetical protein